MNLPRIVNFAAWVLVTCAYAGYEFLMADTSRFQAGFVRGTLYLFYTIVVLKVDNRVSGRDVMPSDQGLRDELADALDRRDGRKAGRVLNYRRGGN